VSSIHKRSIHLRGRKTSVTLEDEFWSALKEVAAARSERVTDLIAAIEIDRLRGLNLSSAIRLFVLRYYRNAAPPSAP
jgi:predicted DNA-binding ribbon-helix-helix protein